jgi:hypothetical protein
MVSDRFISGSKGNLPMLPNCYQTITDLLPWAVVNIKSTMRLKKETPVKTGVVWK